MRVSCLNFALSVALFLSSSVGLKGQEAQSPASPSEPPASTQPQNQPAEPSQAPPQHEPAKEQPQAQPTTTPPDATPSQSEPGHQKEGESQSQPQEAPQTTPSNQGSPSTAKSRTTAKSKSARKKRAATSKTQSKTQGGKVVVRNGGARESTTQISPAVNDQQAQNQRTVTNQLLATTDANLKKVSAAQLTPAQQSMLDQVNTYVRQSKAASDSGDISRAHTLAVKAQLLSNELARK